MYFQKKQFLGLPLPFLQRSLEIRLIHVKNLKTSAKKWPAGPAEQHIKVYLLFWRYDEKCVNIEFFQDFVSFPAFTIFHFKFASQLEESRFCDVNTPEARKKELELGVSPNLESHGRVT